MLKTTWSTRYYLDATLHRSAAEGIERHVKLGHRSSGYREIHALARNMQ